MRSPDSPEGKDYVITKYTGRMLGYDNHEWKSQERLGEDTSPYPVRGFQELEEDFWDVERPSSGESGCCG